MKVFKNNLLACVAFSFGILFYACNNKKDSTTETSSQNIDIRALEKLAPKDAALAEKYSRSCIICHTNPDAKAHLVHDKDDWEKLIKEKGMPTLLLNIDKGFKNMPPKGQCADCTQEDYKNLINFMAGLEK